MDGQILQALSSCSIDQLLHQEASQAPVPMLWRDIDTLEKSRQPPPLFRPRDPLNDDQPSHADGAAFHFDHERQMRALTFGYPSPKVTSKPIRVPCFTSLDCSPDPSQPCELIGIRGVGATGGRFRLRNGCHIHSLYLGSHELPIARTSESEEKSSRRWSTVRRYQTRRRAPSTMRCASINAWPGATRKRDLSRWTGDHF